LYGQTDPETVVAGLDKRGDLNGIVIPIQLHFSDTDFMPTIWLGTALFNSNIKLEPQ